MKEDTMYPIGYWNKDRYKPYPTLVSIEPDLGIVETITLSTKLSYLEADCP